MWFKEGLTLRSMQGQGGVTSEILYLSDVPESLESPDSPGPAEPTGEAHTSSEDLLLPSLRDLSPLGPEACN